MSTVVVSHAYGSDEHSAWYPYLRERLHGHRVEIPNLPDTQAPRLAPWRTALAERAHATPAPETVLVGHSVGAVAVLRLLERHDVERDGAFAGVVLVGAPAHEVGYEALAEFFAEPFDWPAIRRAARTFHVLSAADDPVLVPGPFEHAALFAAELGATATVRPEGGHFLDGELPDAVRLVLDITDNR